MNRKEIITKIQNKLNKAYMLKSREEVDKIIYEIFDDVEKLRQPVTLAEFLGWEEDVEYKCNEDKFIIMDNQLYMRNYTLRDWVDYDVSINRFEQLRCAKKIDPKKYCLRHKFIKASSNKNLNFSEDTSLYNSSKLTYQGQSQFTQQEINDIKKKFNTNLEDFEQVEVIDEL